MTFHKNLIRLKAAAQEYEWGRTGSASLAARLGGNAIGQGFKIDEQKSYAEIWMGTHSNGPAHLFDDPSTSLLSLISTDPTFYLGETLVRKWPSTTHIPYLFKVLSIEKALPLQAHPDKGLAEQLQQKDPSNFVDANHKPEIAVCIGEPLGEARIGDKDTAFTGFVGFRPLDEIKTFLQKVPELPLAIGDTMLIASFIKDPSTDLLKRIYGTLLKRGVEARGDVTSAITKLEERIKKGGKLSIPDGDELAQLVLKVNAQYPGDAGVLATTFFMNFAKLKKGEAIYIGADEVHAYLEGDIIECMAISDNVVNAAFDAPKSLAPQISTFVEMLTYTARPVSHWALPREPYPHSREGRTSQYNPPLEEFVVLGTLLDSKSAGTERLGAVSGPTIGIVTKGKARIAVGKGGEQLELDEGGVVFVAPGNDIEVELLEGRGSEGSEGEVWWSCFGA
ncbi:mannose-6-phosphate isomerase [Trametes versicolor FP-101664 SS1]|uniref:mannose-6-phosphate isomerase n=1 Tax=Trametes versicolor (strain FP-101664) TaxID=717944 RepID=UPI0004621E27|nr:mannose-6-phosphate isomerase [Trametes versicolor FP-101664 SS1]EIW57378.1 mannose-6-phosphate isomerase [Trametes versicolor FP-101664 SS1]